MSGAYKREKPEGPFFGCFIEFNRMKTVVEVGVHAGATTRYLCKAAKKVGGHVHGFDLWGTHGLKGQFQTGMNQDKVSKWLHQEGHRNFTLTTINTREDRKKFEEHLDKLAPIDFAFIDGCHSYLGLKNDFDAVYPRMAKHGIIAFHDSLRIDGCREFVFDLRTKYNDGTFDIMDFPWGTGNRRVGVSILVKRTWPILGLEMDEVAGSPSTKEEIYAKEKAWYKEELEKGAERIKKMADEGEPVMQWKGYDEFIARREAKRARARGRK